MSLSASNTATILQAEFSGDPTWTTDTVSIDSRSLHNNSSTLFFAIKGPNNDAHRFIPELISKDVRNFVVESIPVGLSDQANFFVVKKTVDALQKFAAHHRKQFGFPVIGITGSNGKTIVKEWLNFLLSPDYKIIRSPKSYNSQIGVPLSVLGINEQHNLGIFEAGISQKGEMERLSDIILPTLGILTNIGTAHDEGFSSREEKINEKLKLFDSAETIICRKSDNLPIANQFNWSFSDSSANLFIELKTDKSNSFFHVTHNSKRYDAEIPFRDQASLENAATCLAVMIHLGYDPETISARMKQLYPVEMRLQVKNGIHGTTIIDDSYSSDFQSLQIALDFMESQSMNKKTAILSDIFQSGLREDELYRQLAQILKNNKIGRIIGIGPEMLRNEHLFQNATMFATTDDFLNAADTIDFRDETVLVKGARQFRFERIVSYLEEKTHETVLEINLNAISHNLSFFRSKLKKSTRLMVMIKAFGYGSGSFEIARLLEHHNVDYLGVAFADEGIALKSAGIKLPVMVLNPESTSFEAIIQNGLEPEIYSLKGLRSFIRMAEEKGVEAYPIHIKLDTGMHRLGFEEKNLDELISVLESTNKVSVRSILSHMATSDDEAFRDFSLSQIALFERMSSRLIESLGISPIRHILNTSGISNFPEAQYDMVRLGIGVYGVSNDAEEQKFLQNVGTLKSVISQIHHISAGESVGYGRRFIADKPSVIATIPIGYADGIRRSWGNGVGWVNINGQRATIVGSVCMDMLMTDVTEIECREGDPVIIMGEDPSVIDIANALGTIPYEILTSISQRVKRVFYRE